ncbi:hypothetical protein FJZ36_13115 [Candidatus Poribacteria bacterium]|nr:hypothetical protein [Candidatus Poribacteria bacterium]
MPSRIEGCDLCAVTNLHFVTPQEGWASAHDTSRGLYRLRTSDGGMTWTTETTGEDDYRLLERAQFVNALEGYAVADRYPYFIDAFGRGNHDEDKTLASPVRFYQTNDGGQTWRLREGDMAGTVYFGDVARAKEANRRNLTVLRFITRDFGVAAGVVACSDCRTWTAYRGYILFVTRDGGATWKAFIFGDSYPGDRSDPTFSILPMPIFDIAFVGDRYGWAPAGGAQNLYLFRTTDGGSSWEALSFPGRHETLDVFGTHVLFTTPMDGWSWGRSVATTRNGGDTWVRYYDSSVSYVFFLNADEGWSSGADATTDDAGQLHWRPDIRHSNDGGTTWNIEYQAPTSAGIPRWEAPFRAVFDSLTRTVWVYGWRMLHRRTGVPTGIQPLDRLPVAWGSLKRR